MTCFWKYIYIIIYWNAWDYSMRIIQPLIIMLINNKNKFFLGGTWKGIIFHLKNNPFVMYLVDGGFILSESLINEMLSASVKKEEGCWV